MGVGIEMTKSRKSTVEFTSQRKQFGSSENIYPYAKRRESEMEGEGGVKSSTYPGKYCITPEPMQCFSGNPSHCTFLID